MRGNKSILFWNCVQIAKQNVANSFQQTIVKKKKKTKSAKLFILENIDLKKRINVMVWIYVEIY